MTMGIFTDTKTYADAVIAKKDLIEAGLDATDIFSVIYTNKCTVDPKTLKVWQVQVNVVAPANITSHEEFCTFLSDVQVLVDAA